MTSDKHDKNKEYSLAEAVVLLPKLSKSKFTGSVDIDIVLNVPEKHKKTNIAGSVSLPHQTGKPKTVIVFADSDQAKKAIEAGATEAGLDDLIKKVEEGSIDFDVVISEPTVMAKIAKLGKILGPKGLMPNPNNGTVTADVETAVKEFIAGKVNFKKSDQQAIRAKVGRVDMTPEQLTENITDFVQEVVTQAKKIGGQPIKKVTLSPTMGAGVKIDINSVIA